MQAKTRLLAKDPNALATAAIAILSVVGVVLATAYRLRFGVNFTDEPFYIGLAYRFLLGDHLFVDEVNVIQLFAVALMPLVSAWTHVAGMEGIVLFMRYAYLAFAVATAGGVLLVLRRFLSWPLALVAVSFIPALVPWGAPALSYNTLGSAFVVLGLAAGAHGVAREKRWSLVLSGLAHGAALAVYPTMVALALCYALLLLVVTRERRLLSVGAYALGLAIILVPVLILLVGIGPEHLAASYKVSSGLGTQGGGLPKLVRVAGGALRSLAGELPLLVALGLVVATRFLRSPWKERVALVVVSLLPLAIWPVSGFAAETRSLGIAVYWSLSGLVLFALLRRDADDVLVASHLVIPSLLAGLLYAYSSNNGYLNAGFGLLGAAVAASYFAVRFIHSDGSRVGLSPERLRLLALVPLILVAGLLVRVQFSAVYADEPPRKLTAEVQVGPFRGLRTVPKSAALVTSLQADLERQQRRGDRVLVFDDFPAGYLVSGLRPAANSIWSPPVSTMPYLDSEDILRYYRATGVRPTIAVQMRWYGLTYAPNHPIMRYLKANHFVAVVTRPNYTIYRRADDPVRARQ